MKRLAALARAVLDYIDPPLTVMDVLGPNPLADQEELRDTWEALELKCRECFPEGWEEKLHDAVYDLDSDPDPAPRPASQRRGGAEPAGTGPLSPVPAGAQPLHPAVIISRTFRTCGVAVPAAAAEIVALELSHFYNLTPKKK